MVDLSYTFKINRGQEWAGTNQSLLLEVLIKQKAGRKEMRMEKKEGATFRKKRRRKRLISHIITVHYFERLT